MSQPNKVFCLITAIVAGGILPILLYGFNTSAPASCVALNQHTMSLSEQWLAVITAFGIKPLYMLIALVLIIFLWKQRSQDLTSLRWGLIIFWLGEFACSANYLFFGGRSDFWEFLHNYGMAVGFSFVSYAILAGIDARIIHFTAPKERCSMLNLCRVCIKSANVPCKLQRLFAAMLPAMILVAAIPLCTSLHETSYNTNIFGSIQTYSQPMSCQFFESRYCPLLAMGLLTASWLVLVCKHKEPVALAKILLAASVGPLSFGFMRLFLFSIFRDNLLWFDVWEEITELLFTMAVGYVLWIFRNSLFEKKTLSSGGSTISSL